MESQEPVSTVVIVVESFVFLDTLRSFVMVYVVC